MSQYQEIQKVNNMTIIKDSNGRFGLKDSSNSIVLGTRYDSIEPLCDIDGNRFLRLEKDGLIGIYNTRKVDFAQYCTMTKIEEPNISQRKVKGKEPIFKRSFLKKISFLCWTIPVDLR